MNFDFSMVTMGDIVEYFSSIFTSILKMCGVEVDGKFSIGFIEVDLGSQK